MVHSTRSALRRAAILVAGLAVLPLLAPPASAAQLTLEDARADMWVVEEGGTDPDPAPQASVGDFVRTTFRHRDRRVVVRAEFVDLAPGRLFRLWVALRDEDRRTTWAMVEASRRDRDGSTRLMTNRGRDIDCRVQHRIDYATSTIHFGFPRRCLGGPRSLQFSAMSEHTRRHSDLVHLDNPHNQQATNQSWTSPLRPG